MNSPSAGSDAVSWVEELSIYDQHASSTSLPFPSVPGKLKGPTGQPQYPIRPGPGMHVSGPHNLVDCDLVPDYGGCSTSSVALAGHLHKLLPRGSGGLGVSRALSP